MRPARKRGGSPVGEERAVRQRTDAEIEENEEEEEEEEEEEGDGLARLGELLAGGGDDEAAFQQILAVLRASGVVVQDVLDRGNDRGVCVHHATGHCSLGAACPFSHADPQPKAPTTSEIRASNLAKLRANTSRVTDPKAVRKLAKTECAICLNPLSKPKLDPMLRLKACKHVYHKRCLEEWAGFGEKCPLCANSIV